MATCGHDSSLAVGAVVRRFGDRVGRVDHEVHHHAVDVGRQTVDRGQFGVEVGDHFRQVLPFAAAERNGALDDVAEIGGLLLPAVGVRKSFMARRSSPCAPPPQRLLEGLRDLAGQVAEVGIRV